MEVKIGVQHAPRELVVDYDGSADDVQAAVLVALGKQKGDTEGLLVLEDTHGRRVVVPADRLAYVDIGEQTERRVGFGAL
ncbi:MAG: DUF3107 domain-containing protein [Streptosporangiales bacterium]|nr:DUF3107 domain-containing protein [Streptosporangiales bacterium]